MMRFYGFFRSSAAYRCRIAFNLKDVTPEQISVHLRRNGGEQKQPVYRLLNPQGLVPALEIKGAVLNQSLAIIEWLEEEYPDPPLLPHTAIQRAQVRAFSQVIACDIHPLQNLRVLAYLRDELGMDQSSVEAWCQRWISDGLTACEILLENRDYKSGFAFGDLPGLAEVCLIPQMFSAERFGLDTSRWKRLSMLREACDELQEFKDAHPSHQSDYEV